MENKRYLKKFSTQSDYESQKNSVMGMPHVVLLDDTKEVIYAPKIDYSKEFFTIEALGDGTVGVGIPSKATSLKYRKNNESWVETNKAIQVSVVANDTIQISCVSDAFNGDGCSSLFAISTPFNVKGNIMSLLYGDKFEGQIDLSGKKDTFTHLFPNCPTLQNAENLILPATTLAESCYYGMFYNCYSLTTAPELPATTLADSCYASMFDGCTSLTTAPELLATTLADNCYGNMFGDCTSLINAPGLPATILAKSCYYGMFQYCTNLTSAPELPATTLANNCYCWMFYGCESLTNAPELLATILADNCYCLMFNGCSNLNYIKMLATDISANGCLDYWVSGVASSGTFVKNAAMTSLPNGKSGIPNGWTVETDPFNGHEYVDLGLPSGTLWATQPITNANGEPLYFQWGDTKGWTAEQIQNGEKSFNRNSYKFGEYYPSKYNSDDKKKIIDIEDDAAHVNMGGNWHIPTKEQFEELIANTTQEGNIESVKMIAPNGNFINILNGGTAIDNEISEMAIKRIWTASLVENDINSGYCFYSLGEHGCKEEYRYFGFYIYGVLSE